MGTKIDPGKFDCYHAAEPDEPMFILLGRDRHAPLLVELWAQMREDACEDPAKVAEARELVTQMRSFKRLRDLPKPDYPPCKECGAPFGEICDRAHCDNLPF